MAQPQSGHGRRLCHRKWLMLFFLKFQGNDQQNTLVVDSAKGETGKKAVFSPYCGGETTTYYEQEKGSGLPHNAKALPRCLPTADNDSQNMAEKAYASEPGVPSGAARIQMAHHRHFVAVGKAGTVRTDDPDALGQQILAYHTKAVPLEKAHLIRQREYPVDAYPAGVLTALIHEDVAEPVPPPRLGNGEGADFRQVFPNHRQRRAADEFPAAGFQDAEIPDLTVQVRQRTRQQQALSRTFHEQTVDLFRIAHPRGTQDWLHDTELLSKKTIQQKGRPHPGQTGSPWASPAAVPISGAAIHSAPLKPFGPPLPFD